MVELLGVIVSSITVLGKRVFRNMRGNRRFGKTVLFLQLVFQLIANDLCDES